MYPLSEGDCVRITDSMSDVVNKFKVGQRYNLVVIDNDNNYIGFLSRANTFSAYRQFVSEFSDE
jgi:CIC family chloride channel protein